MTEDFIIQFLKQALITAAKDGGSTFIEELAEALDVKQLEFLRDRITKVLNKKKFTVNVQNSR